MAVISGIKFKFVRTWPKTYQKHPAFRGNSEYSGKQSKGTQGRSTHPCWSELVLRYAVRSWRAKYWPKPLQKSQIHVENFQGCHFLRKKSPCGMLHNESKSFYNLFRSPQYAGLLHIPFIFKKYAVRSQNPNNKHIPFDCFSEYFNMD